MGRVFCCSQQCLSRTATEFVNEVSFRKPLDNCTVGAGFQDNPPVGLEGWNFQFPLCQGRGEWLEVESTTDGQ